MLIVKIHSFSVTHILVVMLIEVAVVLIHVNRKQPLLAAVLTPTSVLVLMVEGVIHFICDAYTHWKLHILF